VSSLTPEIAEQFAKVALGHVSREFPHHLNHLMLGADEVLRPRALHPVFFGSYDWHSCVHGYWTLLRLRRLFPNLAQAPAIEALADDMLTPELIEQERRYFTADWRENFERPYGWAWLLALHSEAAHHGDRHWAGAIDPLARDLAARFGRYLEKLTYPIRAGTHANTAFALIWLLEWADRFDRELANAVRSRAQAFFGQDRDCQAWEPGGDEFLSPALIEALCMRQVLEPDVFVGWLAAFLPGLAHGEPRTLFRPAIVSDHGDGKIAHLDGLNLTRAWCWLRLADALDPTAASLTSEAAATQLHASLPYVEGDYMGEHWLATFALLALEPDAR
jgi:hypothetical protein